MHKMESSISKTNVLECELKKIFSESRHFISCSNIKFNGDEQMIKWYHTVCEHLATLLNKLGDLYRETKESRDTFWRGSIMLYLNQLLTVLALLINIFLEESNVKDVIIEARKYAIKQLLWCLEGLENIVSGGNVIADPSGNFIKWMDAALEKIENLTFEDGKEQSLRRFQETKCSFEEVLCHAMSIAQVALHIDCNIIKGSSQVVLESLSALHNELLKKEPNKAMVNLFKEMCRTKLCSLEERVNTAVLRLSLDVFSNYTTLLNTIHEFCLRTSNKGKIDELESMVADFDLHVDRIMQIGLFAVSCSSETNSGIRIRSCLASLEALESELVPALSTILSDNTSQSKHYANILKTHWQHQAKQLKSLVYHIIDPYAFCKVVNQEVKEILDVLLDDVKSGQRLTKNGELSRILSHGEILKEFIRIALLLDVETIQINKLTKAFKDFKAVLNELGVAADILLTPYNASYNNCMRVIKRCKILTTTIEGLQHTFADNTEEKEDTTIEELPLIEYPKGTEFNNKFLEHIINRGKVILNERSILYKTPSKDRTNKMNLQNPFLTIDRALFVQESIPLCREVNLKKLNFANMNKPKDQTISFNITEILNDLTNLSNTFHNK